MNKGPMNENMPSGRAVTEANSDSGVSLPSSFPLEKESAIRSIIRPGMLSNRSSVQQQLNGTALRDYGSSSKVLGAQTSRDAFKPLASPRPLERDILFTTPPLREPVQATSSEGEVDDLCNFTALSQDSCTPHPAAATPNKGSTTDYLQDYVVYTGHSKEADVIPIVPQVEVHNQQVTSDSSQVRSQRALHPLMPWNGFSAHDGFRQRVRGQLDQGIPGYTPHSEQQVMADDLPSERLGGVDEVQTDAHKAQVAAHVKEQGDAVMQTKQQSDRIIHDKETSDVSSDDKEISDAVVADKPERHVVIAPIALPRLMQHVREQTQKEQVDSAGPVHEIVDLQVDTRAPYQNGTQAAYAADAKHVTPNLNVTPIKQRTRGLPEYAGGAFTPEATPEEQSGSWRSQRTLDIGEDVEQEQAADDEDVEQEQAADDEDLASASWSQDKKVEARVLRNWQEESLEMDEVRLMDMSAGGAIRLHEEADDTEIEEDNNGLPSSKETAMEFKWKKFIQTVIRKLVQNNGLGRKITINCGGLVNVTYEKTLRRFPGTRLTEMVLRGPLQDNDRIALDRNPFAFVEVLNAYRDGVISREPKHIAPDVWVKELNWFGMHRANLPTLTQYMAQFRYKVVEDPNRPERGLRLRTYLILEEPSTSWNAWLFSLVSISMIVMSVTLVCVETLPVIDENAETTKLVDDIDFGIVVFFTFEYFLRLLVTVNRVRFIYQPLNIVDLVSIFPTYLTYFIESARSFNGAKFFRLLRVLRVFKLTRHSDGMMVLARTALACSDELMLLLFCVIVFTILYSALVFVCEEDNLEGPGFRSIPATFWWAIVTITTIGYGDMYPTTGLGRFFGALCALTGVVLVALPISVISSTFNNKVQENMTLQEVRVLRKKHDRKLISAILDIWGLEARPNNGLGTMVSRTAQQVKRKLSQMGGSWESLSRIRMEIRVRSLASGLGVRSSDSTMSSSGPVSPRASSSFFRRSKSGISNHTLQASDTTLQTADLDPSTSVRAASPHVSFSPAQSLLKLSPSSSPAHRRNLQVPSPPTPP